MPRPDFSTLQSELLNAGIKAVHVRRTLIELDNHFDDLVNDRLDGGIDRQTAEREALKQLGDLSFVAEQMLAAPELRSWSWRWPRLALIVYPFACLAALPAVPFVAGIEHAASVGRWMAGFLLAGLVTASMFLLLQLTITMS